MNTKKEHPASYWRRTASLPAFPTLLADVTADVCVIGAGIAGLSTAYLLAKAGKSVVVLDDGEIASGETGNTTAHLTAAVDTRYTEIEKMFGAEGSKLVADSHKAAIDLIESIVQQEAIDCGFKRLDAYLFAPAGEPANALDAEYAASQQAGLEGVRLLAALPLSFLQTGPCIQYPQQAQFHPLQYLAGLIQAIQRNQGQIYTQTRATSIDGTKVGTNTGHSIEAQAVVVATNSPMNDLVVMHTKQAAYRTYAIGLQVAKGAIPPGLYWDTLDPYHYVRLTPAEDAQYEVLIVGGEDHKTGQGEPTEERFTQLEEWARANFPMSKEVVARWSGQVLEPADGLAFIGRNPLDPGNTYIVTGTSGNGMTYGTIAGIMIRDAIVGKENPWAELYAPNRKPIHALSDFAMENLNVAAQYADWITPGEVRSVDEIKAGSGALMRQGAGKLAIYRDTSGELHTLSATCPHLGCVVRWNGVEQSWDCPCHGSRFDAYGHLLNGPANQDLETAPSPEGDKMTR